MDKVEASELCLHDCKKQQYQANDQSGCSDNHKITQAYQDQQKWQLIPHLFQKIHGFMMDIPFTWIWYEGRSIIKNLEVCELQNRRERKKEEKKIGKKKKV